MNINNLLKKCCAAAFILVIYVMHVTGQSEPVVKLSQPFKLGGGELFAGHLLSNEHGHIVYTTKGTFAMNPKMFIKKLDKKFNVIKSVELKADKKNTYVLGLYSVKQKIFMLSMEKDKENDRIKYFLVPFDDDITPGKTKKIAEFQFEKRSDQPRLETALSQDSTTSAFIFYLDNDHKEDKFEMYTTVVNEHGEIKWSKKAKINRPQKVVELLGSSVNNEGNVYMIIKEFEGDRAKESKRVEKGDDKIDKPAYEINIYKYNGQTDDKKEIKVDLKNNFVANCNIKVLPNGDMTVIGMYSTTKKLFVNGVFSIRMNGTTDSIYMASRRDFTSEDLAVLEDEDVTSKHKDETGLGKFFKFLDFKTRPDGTTTLVMEENYMIMRASRVGNTVTYTPYYYTNEAIVLNLNAKGEIQNMAILPKKQVFAGVEVYNSSTVLFTDNGLHLVHVEQKDNLKKPYGEKVKKISTLNDCVVVDIYLSTDGKAERTTLLTKQDVKALLAPKISKRIKENEIFFFMLKPGFLGTSAQYVGTITY